VRLLLVVMLSVVVGREHVDLFTEFVWHCCVTFFFGGGGSDLYSLLLYVRLSCVFLLPRLGYHNLMCLA
jgi:hypothetical protein